MLFFLTFLLFCPSSPVTPMPSDLQFMSRALALAERGLGFVSPNPLVGCVLAKGGKVVGEGFHAAFGGPHAEAAALAQAGPRAKGATAYVTLEPCAHWGKTAPCADALIRAGVKKVVAALGDPHRRVAGRGFQKLRRAGLRVEKGLMAREAAHQNRAFLKAHTAGLPYVVWKTAQTLDGKIASRTGASKWITNPQARALAHRLRAQSDAVLVGGNTVRRDNPVLTTHGQGPDPVKLILSASLDLSPRARVFQQGTTWLLTARNASPARARRLEAAGASILKFFVKFDTREFVECFKKLSKIGLQQIFVEGGGETAATLLSAALMDEVYHVIAPRYLGGRAAVTPLEGEGWPTPDQGPQLSRAESYPLGDNVVIHGFFN
jgi:diaminohydroxyphosphoribosylaminopyrimidine deaminase / 5-amino-6-(5-phosphoribosylamino)uracil reductase